MHLAMKVDLTYVEKVALILSCCGLLFIVALLTICFVCPPCWIHRRMKKRERLLAENNPHWYIQNNFELSFLDPEAPPPYEETRRTSVTELANGSEYIRRLVSLPSTNTASYSDCHPFAGIPLPSLTDVNIPYHPEEDEKNKGLVSIAMQFKRIQTHGKLYTQLRVDLREAYDLHMRLRGGKPNPYFIIALYDSRTFKKSKRNKGDVLPLFEFVSAVVRKTQHPVYNETFFFPMENRYLKKCVLKIEAWDQDKLTNDTCLGTVKYYLRDVEKLLLEDIENGLDVTLKLEEAKFNYGKILLGLCYLPTSERLTVAVLRADNLMRVKTSDVTHETEGFFVEGLTMYDGKISNKRKTNTLPVEKLPFFNEMIMFDAPKSKFPQICLVIAVYSTLSKGHDKKDTCIGKCVIGANSRKKAAQQWANIQNQPRRQIIEWHEIK